MIPGKGQRPPGYLTFRRVFKTVPAHQTQELSASTNLDIYHTQHTPQLFLSKGSVNFLSSLKFTWPLLASGRPSPSRLVTHKVRGRKATAPFSAPFPHRPNWRPSATIYSWLYIYSWKVQLPLGMEAKGRTGLKASVLTGRIWKFLIFW